MGKPVKKKTMITRYAAGGSVEGRPSKLKMAWDSVKDNVASLPRRAIGVAKDALTPTPIVNEMENYKEKQKKEIDAAFDNGEAPGKRAGGKIKARGVGKALRGHGKAFR